MKNKLKMILKCEDFQTKNVTNIIRFKTITNIELVQHFSSLKELL